MSEMLGNRYFMARQFKLALPHLQATVEKAPANARARKRLVVCYLEAGMTDLALGHFLKLVTEAPAAALLHEVGREICPCTELIELRRQHLGEIEGTAKDYLAVGILRAWHDLPAALDNLRQAQSRTVEFPMLPQLISRLEDWQKNHPRLH